MRVIMNRESEMTFLVCNGAGTAKNSACNKVRRELTPCWHYAPYCLAFILRRSGRLDDIKFIQIKVARFHLGVVAKGGKYFLSD